MARLFFLENLAVGAVALALGLVAGNLLYQVLRALVLALFGVTYHFAFAFSGKTVGLTWCTLPPSTSWPWAAAGGRSGG